MDQERSAITFTLQEFTRETLRITQEDWTDAAGEDEFATEYGFVFEWAEHHMDYENNAQDSLAYGMFMPDSAAAVAIVEVIQSKKAQRGLTKMLKLWITPEYWDADGHRIKIAEIMICAMQGTLQISKQNQSKTVKIYGRTDQMLSILHTVHAKISERISDGRLVGVSVNIVGRWLEIQLAEKGREK